MPRFISVIAGLVAAAALGACARYLPSSVPPQSALVQTGPSLGVQSDFRILHRFGPNRANWPVGLTRFKNGFYGVLNQGGTHDLGAVFTATDSGRVRVVYDFGTNGGRKDASRPAGSLIDVGGALYGLGSSGGTNGTGALYRITPNGRERVVYNFRERPVDGEEPLGDLVAVGSTLYGVTTQGGEHDFGTVFSVSTSGTERVLHRFAGFTDGEGPQSGLKLFHGVLYGTTGYAGNSGSAVRGCGTIFRIDPSGENYRVMYRFRGGSNGCGPSGELVAVRGALYGTTDGGGRCNTSAGYCGIVYRITPEGVESVVYTFQSRKDGEGPGGLIAVADTLYGTTFGGGGVGKQEFCGFYSHGCGTIFSIDASGRNERVLHAFRGNHDGAGGGRLLEFDGRLYGVTTTGGSGETPECGRQEYGPTGCGTIFRMKL